MESNTLVDALELGAKYCNEKSYHLYDTVIWLLIENNECRVLATNGTVMRQVIYRTNIDGRHIITIPGRYARRISEMVSSEKNSHQQIEYNDSYVKLYSFDRDNGVGEAIEFPLSKDKLPDLKSLIINPVIVYKVRLSLNDLTTVFRIIETLWSREQYIVMHFFKGHVNVLFEDDVWNKRVYQFIDTDNTGDDFVLKTNYLYFSILINDLFSDKGYITLFIDEYDRIHFVGEDEDLDDTNAVILGSLKMNEKDVKLLERGEESLRSNGHYSEKYLKDNISHANAFQIAEAISRMEKLGVDEGIIDEFKKKGTPQLFEPPYGASYLLDNEEDRALLDAIERLRGRGLLVWGVIRSMMTYNQKPITVDCMLYVSSDKKEWPSERENLFSGYPHVFTISKEMPTLKDQGSISIYMSIGGTPLRRI